MVEARAQGADLLRVADTVVENGFLCKTVPLTLSTYASHLRMIVWASELFGEPPLGCSAQHILRVAAVCACAAKQRGWLSARAMAHQVAGVPWQGDRDAILRGVWLGTVKGRTPRLPRQSVDKALLKALLRHAFPQGRVWWCLIAVLTYNSLLRMPSELFRQHRGYLLQVLGNRFLYGPIRRKQRQDVCTTFAFCLCHAV